MVQTGLALPSGIYNVAWLALCDRKCLRQITGLANILLPGMAPRPRCSRASRRTARTESLDFLTGATLNPTSVIPGKIGGNVTLDYGFRWSFYREPYAGTSGGNTNPASDGGGNFPNQWANFSMAAWSAAQAKANPSDAGN